MTVAKVIVASKAHRKSVDSCAVESYIVHCKWQTRLRVICAHCNECCGAQCVIEVGRVYLSALMRRAYAQPRQPCACTAPRLHERAITGAVLQANRLETVVKQTNVTSTRVSAQRCVIDALRNSVRATRSRTVHRRILQGIDLATAHLEAPTRCRALDEQAGCLQGEWLQELHIEESRCASRSRHLEIARAWEDDASLHDVVGN